MNFPLQKTFVTLNKYNFNSYNDDSCVATITIKDYNGNAIPNQSVDIYFDDVLLETGTTNNNGVYQCYYDFEERSEIGLHTFRVNECIIKCKVYYDTDWINVSFKINYQNTANSSANLKYRVMDSVVNIVGQVNNKKKIDASNDTIASIPTEYAPAKNVQQLAQGSTANKWLLRVSPAGDIIWDRYGTTSIGSNLPYSDYPQWLVINVMYTI